MAKGKQTRPIDIKTKIRGVSQPEYQKNARRCRAGDSLLLLREPRNKFDRNAIAVYRRGMIFKKQIGYLSADIAEQLAARMDGGERLRATVLDVTGGGWLRRKTTGVNVHVLPA